jgi:nicotinamide-nucleotide amidase
LISVYLAAGPDVERALAGLAPAELRRTADGLRLSVEPGAAAGALERLRSTFGAGRVLDGGRSLAGAVADSFAAAGASLALAESCTGGLVAKALTDLAGASRYFHGGVVAYANDAKVRLLGVPAETIARHGAVSAEVVEAMARGAASAFAAAYAAAISGVAGPDGGTADKPVGTVWIGISRPGGRVEAHRYLFRGGRGRIRGLAALQTLLLLREALAADRS